MERDTEDSGAALSTKSSVIPVAEQQHVSSNISMGKSQSKVKVKIKVKRKSLIKVKRRRSVSKPNVSKTGLNGSSTSVSSQTSTGSDDEMMKTYYHLKTEKVVKSVEKRKIKIKKKRKAGKTAQAAEPAAGLDIGKFTVEVTSDSDSDSTSSSSTISGISADTLYQSFDVEVIECTPSKPQTQECGKSSSKKKPKLDVSKFVSQVDDDKDRSLMSKGSQIDKQSVAAATGATGAQRVTDQVCENTYSSTIAIVAVILLAILIAYYWQH